MSQSPTSAYLSPLSSLQSRSQPVTLEDMLSSYNSVLSSLGPSSQLEKIHASTMAQYDTACMSAIAEVKRKILSCLPGLAQTYRESKSKQYFILAIEEKFEEEVSGWKGSGNNDMVENSRRKAKEQVKKRANVAFDKAMVKAQQENKQGGGGGVKGNKKPTFGDKAAPPGSKRKLLSTPEDNSSPPSQSRKTGFASTPGGSIGDALGGKGKKKGGGKNKGGKKEGSGEIVGRNKKQKSKATAGGNNGTKAEKIDKKKKALQEAKKLMEERARMAAEKKASKKKKRG